MIIPNAFQTPNIYIDRVMPYLTESEIRVLLYATRHILGWQDKIKKRKNTISITMFERGFTTRDGVYYAGCGLGRAAIIKALASLQEFGLLAKDGEANADGQKWTLETVAIDWEKLEARQSKQVDAFKARTEKARAKAAAKREDGLSDTPDEGGLSDTPEVVSGTNQDWFVGQTQTKPLSKPSSKPFKNNAPDGAADGNSSSENENGHSQTNEPDGPVFDKERVFDCVAWAAFHIKDMRALRKKLIVKGKEKDNPASVLIGKISNWLNKFYPERDEPEVAQKVIQFYQDWPSRRKYNIPQNLEKFAKEWIAWDQENLPDPMAGVVTTSKEAPTDLPLR